MLNGSKDKKIWACQSHCSSFYFHITVWPPTGHLTYRNKLKPDCLVWSVFHAFLMELLLSLCELWPHARLSFKSLHTMKAVSRETRALREFMTKSDLYAPLDQGIAGVGPAGHANWSTLMAKGLLRRPVWHRTDCSLCLSRTCSLHRSMALVTLCHLRIPPQKGFSGSWPTGFYTGLGRTVVIEQSQSCWM